MAQRFVFQNFTAREFRVIEMRTSGMRPREIARRMGVSAQAIYAVIIRVYRKSGTTNTAQLTRWAWETGLDVPTPPDTEETAAVPEVKVRKNLPIRLGRIRRARR